MIRYMKYGPYICIAVVLFVLFVLWAFWGGKSYEFVGLAPLDPDTCGSYTGSVYNWGNITPAINNNVPVDVACLQETTTASNDQTQEEVQEPMIDNTPKLPIQYQQDINMAISNAPEYTCINEESVNLATPEQQPTILDAMPPHPVRTLPQPFRRGYKNGKRGRFVSRGERLCCQTMERIYEAPFETIRPDWLINPETGEKLELDCYNEELQIAVEYNGEQHYTWPNFTNQTYQQFINQVRRDQLKIELCDRNGVYLIVVPYNVSHDKIPEFIISHLPETLQKRLHEEHILSNVKR